MLTAYLDESGHSKDTNFVGISGIVAAMDKWEIFEEKWQAVLTEYGLDYCHMSEFAHSVGQFDGWDKDESKRRRFLAQIVNIIDETEGKIFSSVVDNVEFKKRGESLQMAVDPYYLCFQDCLKAIAINGTFEPPNEKVAMVFECQTEFAAKALKLWQTMKKRKDEVYQRIGAFSMDDGVRLLPLQAADFIAYETTKYCENLVNRPQDKMRWGMQQIVNMSLKHQGFVWLDFYGRSRLLEVAIEYSEGYFYTN